MKLKQILATMLFLIVSSMSLIAQDNEKKTITKEEILKDLTKVSMKEIIGKKFIKDTYFFDENGKKLSMDEYNSALKSKNYKQDFYVNKEGDVKAVVLSKLTEEDIKKREERRKRVLSMKRSQEKELLGKEAIPFSVTDIEGNEYSLDKLKEKVVVLNFWFVQCEPCIREIPDLNNLVEKYKDKDVVFIAFNVMDDSEKIQSFLKKNNFSYKLIPKSLEIAQKYKSMVFPTHIIIGKSSKIEHVTSGLQSTTIADLDKKIEELIH